MKKIIIILIIPLVILATQSCNNPPLPADKKTDTPLEDEVNPYVGTWEYTNVEFANGVLEIMGNEVGSFTGEGSSLVGEVVLTEDPNRYTTSLSFTAEIDADFAGQQQEQSTPVPTQTSSGTWSQSNGQLTLIDDNGEMLEIISSTTSRIVFTGEFFTQIPAQFFTIDASSDLIFTIEK